MMGTLVVKGLNKSKGDESLLQIKMTFSYTDTSRKTKQRQENSLYKKIHQLEKKKKLLVISLSDSKNQSSVEKSLS